MCNKKVRGYDEKDLKFHHYEVRHLFFMAKQTFKMVPNFSFKERLRVIYKFIYSLNPYLD